LAAIFNPTGPNADATATMQCNRWSRFFSVG
jgi:hypothetical protein